MQACCDAVDKASGWAGRHMNEKTELAPMMSHCCLQDKYWNRQQLEDLFSNETSWAMDRADHHPELGIESGVMTTDGDGTVPLLSLGLLCQHPQGWRGARLNPAGISIVCREYPHQPSTALLDPRYISTLYVLI